MSPTVEELRALGYAPGGYMVKCWDCGNRNWEADKRAFRCLPCAVAAWRAAWDDFALRNTHPFID